MMMIIGYHHWRCDRLSHTGICFSKVIIKMSTTRVLERIADPIFYGLHHCSYDDDSANRDGIHHLMYLICDDIIIDQRQDFHEQNSNRWATAWLELADEFIALADVLTTTGSEHVRDG